MVNSLQLTTKHGSSSQATGEHKDAGSPKVYVVIFAVLIGLTVLTAICSKLPLGRWEVVVALSIASVKAALVTLFFMHLIHMKRLNWIIVAAGVFWLALAFTLTLADYMTRSWYSVVSDPQSSIRNLQQVERDFKERQAAPDDDLPGEEIR